MALILYPVESYDSFISLIDADAVIAKYSVNSSKWLELDEVVKEVYLRIATDRIINAVSTDTTNEYGYLDSTTYTAEDSCLPKACALIAMNDLDFLISQEVNPNTGLVQKEKVGDIERTFFHGYPQRHITGLNKNPFPSSVTKCLNSYGASLNTSSLKQATFLRS